jgi:glycosyltransferase involved in cell wall biosynthesis
MSVECSVKIAQIAPLIESVPPRFYGGTERVVSYLTEELVRSGHEVTLFASGDSVTSAQLVSCATRALRLDPNVRDPIPYYMLMLDRVRECADDFDILHFHIDQFHFPLFRRLAGRTVTTLHGRQDLPDLRPLYFGFNEEGRDESNDAYHRRGIRAEECQGECDLARAHENPNGRAFCGAGS